MAKLKEKDFKYYKDWINESKQEHRKNMLDLNQPEEVIASYEGFIEAGRDAGAAANFSQEAWENYIFIAQNTILPQLFYQFPRSIIKPKSGMGSEYSASVMQGMINQTINDAWKIENQLCILDTYMPYGYGVMKVAYNSRRGYAPSKPSKLTGSSKVESAEGVETEEYIAYERPVIQRHSPKYAFLDYEQPFHQPKRITFEHPKKSLKDIISTGLYDITPEFIRYFAGRTDGDLRRVKLDLYEHFCHLDNGVWKLCYVDEWDEPLCWVKTKYRGLPIALIRFSKASDRLYSISHGCLATKAQRELQYENELWKKHVDGIRRQHLVNENALTEAGKRALRDNEIDGIVTTNGPVTAGTYAQISSNTMGKDVYANIENVRNYLKLLLNTTGGRGGEANVEFAETEKQQAAGDMMRTSGMQDAIRDFARKQIRLTISNIYRLGSPETVIKLTGKDVRDPVSGELIAGTMLRLGPGTPFQQEIEGEPETDYLYDVDITSASRPDFAIIRKQLNEAIQLAMALRPVLREQGKDIDITDLFQDFMNAFDTLPDPSKYVRDLSEEEKQAMALQAQMAAQGAMVKPTAKEPAPSLVGGGM